MGLRLSAKASRSIREKAALLSGKPRVARSSSSAVGMNAGDMKPPPAGFTPRKTVQNLTPAAKALLQRFVSAVWLKTWRLYAGQGAI